MSLTNPNKVITEERLSEFYQGILPYLGGMPDILANKFSKADLYSTDEKIVGQWINGKPVYQKVITGLSYTPILTSWSNTGVNIPNCEQVVSCGFGQNNGNFLYIAFCKCNNNGDLEAWFSTQIYEYQTMLVQYTKTTDSPVEIGNDTDYSTTEKIVGTWIDGKPLYQIVIPTVYVGINFYDYPVATIPNYSNITIRRIEGYNNNNKGGTSFATSMSYSHPDSSRWSNYFWVDDSTGKIMIGAGTSQTVTNPLFIIQYTKITD